MKKLLFVLIVSGIAAAFRPGPPLPPPNKPKNIILLIGDGMGLTQVTAGLYSHQNTLNLEQFPVTGIMTTHAFKHLITDSAAGATAFSCGCKTQNGVLGQDKNGKDCTTILEKAVKQGLATGLVATSSITHATPAAFIAHVGSRSETEQIATFFLQTQVDFLVGGGLKYFNERKSDSLNLYRQLAANGYIVHNFAENKLQELTPDPAHPFVWFSAREEPGSALSGRDYLTDAAQKAPVFLKQRSTKGFFMMLEGSQIDWACHSNEAEEAISEMLDFDAAIGEILKFAKADGETLVIVTADHETGGMAIEQGSSMDSLDIDFLTNHHTASLVPVFAYGPGAELFNGVMDNTSIYQKMTELLGL